MLDQPKSWKPRKGREPRESGVQTTGSPNNRFRKPDFPYIFQDENCQDRAFLRGGPNLGERHSRDTRDDGTMTPCTLCATTVLSRDCRADFGRPLTKKVMSHLRDGPGVTCGQILYLSPGGWNPPPQPLPPPLKSYLLKGPIE